MRILYNADVVLLIKFLPLDFLGVSHRINFNERMKMPFTVCKYLDYFQRYSSLKNKVCKWDDWWCHILNPILHHLYKKSYLGPIVAQIIETWQANSSIENTPKAIKHFVAMATHSFPVPTHFKSICKWFSARKTLYEATNSS